MVENIPDENRYTVKLGVLSPPSKGGLGGCSSSFFALKTIQPRFKLLSPKLGMDSGIYGDVLVFPKLGMTEPDSRLRCSSGTGSV